MKQKPKFYYVYIITNKILNKKYVGSKVCYKDNPSTDGYMGSSKYLNDDYKIYDIENFKKEILCDTYLGKNDLLDGETEYIKKFNTLAPNGYNRFLPNTRKGFCMIGIQKIPWNKGLTLSEKQKKNMRKPKSEAHKKKVGLTKIGNTYMLGKHHSNLTKEKMRNAKLGKNQSPIHIQHKIEARKNKSQKSPFKILCPYCNNYIDSRNYKRWHGEKCKLNYNKI